MTERFALESVEETHGSIEQFALFVLTEAPDVLDNSKSILLRAQQAKLEPKVLTFLLTQSTAFRRHMRGIMVNQSFDLAAELKHINMVKVAATNSEQKQVVTPKGVIAEVDHSPDEIMKAGEYLNKYRGTPLSAGQVHTGPSLVINFGSPTPSGGGDDGKTLTVESPDVAPTGFKRLRAGQLPPPGAQKRYLSGEDSGGKRHSLTREGSELDFYSEEAKGKKNLAPPEQSEPVPSESGGRGEHSSADWTEKW